MFPIQESWCADTVEKDTVGKGLNHLAEVPTTFELKTMLALGERKAGVWAHWISGQQDLRRAVWGRRSDTSDTTLNLGDIAAGTTWLCVGSQEHTLWFEIGSQTMVHKP